MGGSSLSTEEISQTRREQWTHQVHVLFPHLPLTAIQESLTLTNSVEVTVDQILEGTIYIPPDARSPGAEYVDEDHFGNVNKDRNITQETEQQKDEPSTSKQVNHTNSGETSHPNTANNSHPKQPNGQTKNELSADVNVGSNDINLERQNVQPLNDDNVDAVGNVATTSNADAASKTKRMGSTSSVVRRRKKMSSGSGNSGSDHSETGGRNSFSNSYDATPRGSHQAVFGERFSKNPEERHMILQQRKAQMIESCRRDYLQKQEEQQYGEESD